jgi:PPOX class probable F420-dependent enzyme
MGHAVHMTDLSIFAELVPREHGLSVVVTRRADGSPRTSVVNAGVVAHPWTGAPVVAFVSGGGARRLADLRSDPSISVVIRAGWQWATAEGAATLIGPDDPHAAVDEERLRTLLREVFIAAGGTHDDWHEYDRVMREDRRTVVLVDAARVTSNAS